MPSDSHKKKTGNRRALAEKRGPTRRKKRGERKQEGKEPKFVIYVYETAIE